VAEFSKIIPGLPQLTLDTPAETCYNTGVGQGLSRPGQIALIAPKLEITLDTPAAVWYNRRRQADHHFYTSILHFGAGHHLNTTSI